MTKIYFIFRDIEIFKKRNPSNFNDDFTNYYEEIKNDIGIPNVIYTHFDNKVLSRAKPDLIIAEDTGDTINNLIKSALESTLVKTIFICDDLSSFEKILENDIRPKLITLDFMFKNVNTIHDNILTETLEFYQRIREKWSNVPILGITNFKKDKGNVIDKLKQALEDNGDHAYSKDNIYPILAEILDQTIITSKAKSLKKKMEEGDEDVDEIVEKLNVALLRKEVDLENEEKAKRLIKYLDLQEKLLKFITDNDIKYKSESLAGAILYYEDNPEFEFKRELITQLNTTSREIYKSYNLPNQPLAAIQKYFKPVDEMGIMTKEAIIIIDLIKKNPTKWAISIGLAKGRMPQDPNFKTFLDRVARFL